jgi:hypothetical protein
MGGQDPEMQLRELREYVERRMLASRQSFAIRFSISVNYFMFSGSSDCGKKTANCLGA